MNMEFRNDGNNDPICDTAKETQTLWEKARVG